MTSRKILATNLRKERARLRISQEALAGDADVHRTYIGSIERGERNVSIDNLDRIAKALNKASWELLVP